MSPHCEWCGRAIKQEDGRWLAVKGVERGYDPVTCEANTEDGLHEPAANMAQMTQRTSHLIGKPGLGGWDYRVFERQVPTGEGDTEPEFFIGEAYYSEDDGTVVAWSGPVEVIGGDHKASVRDELRRMWNALDKPTLDYDATPNAQDDA